jgi:hypothetical protein
MERAQLRFDTEISIKKQLRIAVQHRIVTNVPGKFKKRHCMDCGRPLCGLCGNPRRRGLKPKDAKTFQELRFEQGHRVDL